MRLKNETRLPTVKGLPKNLIAETRDNKNYYFLSFALDIKLRFL